MFFGSAWPIWIFATLLGVVVAVVVRQILLLLGWHKYMPLPALFYTAIWLSSSILIYDGWVGIF